MPLTRQHHKRALVTGGSRGICCATVRRAAREVSSVVWTSTTSSAGPRRAPSQLSTSADVG